MNRKLFLILPLLLLLPSCSSGGSYSYTNPEENEYDYGPEVEANVVLDGVANESFYDNNNVYRIDHANGESQYSEVRFGFGNKGLLAHAYVHEKTIYENFNVSMYEQDSFELYINPNVQEYQLYSNCVQFRVSPLLRRETWIGMKTPEGTYPWTFYYVPFRYATKINGKVITSDDQYFNDEYTNSDGVEYEFYIPYTSLGLDYNPKGLSILPAMVTTNSLEADDHTWSSYNKVDITDLPNYIKVGHRVFKDQGNNVFNTDLTTPGFILDHQLDATHPYIVNYGLLDQYAYFNTLGDMFYAKAKVTLYSNLKNDQYPKVGIGTTNDQGTKVMLLDPRPNKDCFEALLVDRVGYGEWGWDVAPISWYGDTTYSQPITLEIVRNHLDIYFFMNGGLLFTSNALVLGGDESYPILMTMNHSAIFEECMVTTDETTILNRIDIDDPYLDHDKSTYGFIYSAGVYSQNGTKDQYGIFSQGGKNYTMSVDINIGNNLEGDLHPKIGIGEISSTKVNAFLLDPKPQKNNYEIVHLTGDAGPMGENNWVWGDTMWQGSETYDRVFNFKIERINDVTKFYVDNELVYTQDDNAFGSEDSYPMFLTMNHSGTFSNVSITVS